MGDNQSVFQFVYNLYDGPAWKQRVRKMSDAQITAIYFKEQAKAKEDTPKPVKEGEDEIPF